MKHGHNAIVLQITTSGDDAASREMQAAKSILAGGLELAYWIEIARDPVLADAHPQWMASLQGHQNWRRLHPDFPQVAPDTGAVVKNYPWVPILYREAFDAHLQRVETLLHDKPPPSLIFLNDLQGAPSACGCGNILCRWTADYGPIKTATPAGDDAAAQFVTKVRAMAPQSQVIPVWVTECEQHDGTADGACAGVGCFEGICWQAYTRQLMPLAAASEKIAVLLPVRELQRELPVFQQPAGWIAHALESFQTMPAKHGGKAVDSRRLIAILQGWDVDDDLVREQIARARGAGVDEYVIARTRIEQGWRPRLFRC